MVEVVFWLAAALPERMVPPLGKGLGFMLHRLVRFRRQRIRHHLAGSFPELDALEQRRLLRRVYNHFGLLVVELLRLPRMGREALLARCNIEGLENLEGALARKRGAMVLTGHLGNWEISLAAAALALDCKVAAVTKEIKGDIGQYIADRFRRTYGVIEINRRQAIKPILSILKENGVVGFVLDQNMKNSEGVFVDFFGRPACTMPGLAVLARRYQAPVVPVVFFRDEQGRHNLRFLPEIPWEEPPGNDGAEAAVQHNTQRYTAMIEAAVRNHPEQWLWMHGRWRTQPVPEEKERVREHAQS